MVDAAVQESGSEGDSKEMSSEEQCIKTRGAMHQDVRSNASRREEQCIRMRGAMHQDERSNASRREE